MRLSPQEWPKVSRGQKKKKERKKEILGFSENFAHALNG